MARAFVDTNVLAYAVASEDAEKEVLARSELSALERDGNAVVSTQVLQELFSLMTRKRRYPPMVALGILNGLESMQLIEVNRSMIYMAARITESHSVSFWNALILAAAVSSGCRTLLTEDLNHGQIIEGVEIRKPFVTA